MLRIIRCFFFTLSKIDLFLRQPFKWGMSGFQFIFCTLILFGVIGMKVDEFIGFDLFIKQTTFLMGTLIYCLIPYMFYKGDSVKKYILFGRKEAIEESSKKFNNKGYVLFVAFFSYFLFFPLLGIPMLIRIFQFNSAYNFIINNVVVLAYVLISITSILWFSYHIVNSKVSLQKIKIKVAQYIAIASTLALFKLRDFEQFTVVASCLVVSYLWIQYIIELRAEEELSLSDSRKAVAPDNNTFTHQA
ncbi:hypothetical protein [Paenibacillus sp. 22594]|uniref:hypothetical protein n=1 Tax=Paenibacillus sp. 22594 TaxID=3453947 RepID=UPI003F87B3D5